MKKLIVAASVGLIGAVCLAALAKRATVPAIAGAAACAERPIEKLVVHEWGTFTGFAGTDGVHLPFTTLVGSDLPQFVVNRQKQAFHQNPNLQLPLLFLKGGGLAALQRMETPIMYFYSDSPVDVNVRVDFPQGSLTEFYPPVRNMGPSYGEGFGEAGAGPQTRPAESFLDWGNLKIIPHPSGDQGKLIPAVAAGSRYSFARNTDAALIQFADADGTRHEEKFLFYRGLGNFTLPVTLLAGANDHFELRNASLSPITSVFLIQVSDDHKTTRFARFENAAGNQPLTLPPSGSTPGELSGAIANSLIAEGLYEKEARAMVETWKSTWLDEPGTRLLYIVPRPVTDALLPLQITPRPRQTIRVLVGRIDILTPECEARLRSLMLAANATSCLTEEDGQMLLGLDRFLAPAMQRISKLTNDADGTHAQQLYQAFYRWREGRLQHAN